MCESIRFLRLNLFDKIILRSRARSASKGARRTYSRYRLLDVRLRLTRFLGVTTGHDHMRSMGCQRSRGFQAKTTVRSCDKRHPSLHIRNIVHRPIAHTVPPGGGVELLAPVIPPSTSRSHPVMKEASAPTRKSTAEAISSGFPCPFSTIRGMPLHAVSYGASLLHTPGTLSFLEMSLYAANQPLSAVRIAPLTLLASSEARKAITDAICSG